MTFDPEIESQPVIIEPGYVFRRSAQAKQEWLTTEVETLRRVYPRGGAQAVRAELPGRTLEAIRAKASALRIKCRRPPTQGLRFARIYPQRDDIDNAVREGYMHATAKGAIKALAQRIGRPAWWVQKRAAQLGVSRTNQTRLDSWSAAELALLEEFAPCTVPVIVRKLRDAGHWRTATAVAVKLKRLHLERENPDRWSATALAPMLGVNPSTVADWIERRGLPATREGAGRGRMMIDRKPLRAWICAHPRYIDLRRVDQTWFMDLICNRA
jgi:hypothetical protein